MKRSDANASTRRLSLRRWNSDPVFVASKIASRSSKSIATEAEPSISANVSRVAATRSLVSSRCRRRRPARISLSSSPWRASRGWRASRARSFTTMPLCSATTPRVITGWLLSPLLWLPLVASRECPTMASAPPVTARRRRSYVSNATSSKACSLGLASRSAADPACLRTSMRSPSWTATPAASRPRVCEKRRSETARVRARSRSRVNSLPETTPKIPHTSVSLCDHPHRVEQVDRHTAGDVQATQPTLAAEIPGHLVGDEVKGHELPGPGGVQHTRAVPLQQARQRSFGKEPQVLRGRHQPPVPAEQTRGEGTEIARAEDQQGAGPRVAVDGTEDLVGGRQVLEDIEHDDHIEGSTIPVERLVRLLHHIQLTLPARGHRLG